MEDRVAVVNGTDVPTIMGCYGTHPMLRRYIFTVGRFSAVKECRGRQFEHVAA